MPNTIVYVALNGSELIGVYASIHDAQCDVSLLAYEVHSQEYISFAAESACDGAFVRWESFYEGDVEAPYVIHACVVHEISQWAAAREAGIA